MERNQTVLKKYILLLFLFQSIDLVQAQIPEGKFIYDRLYSASLINTGGEEPTRRISIYLPPGYDDTKGSYPVIYYLHGITQRDSTLIAANGIQKLLDNAIATGKIKPIIFVMSDQYTLYRGSFYTNSSLTGKWTDFTAKDLVKHVDQNYRTIPRAESRGIAGHSMGGHGAIKLGMLFPEVFSSVYSLSPYVLDLEVDYGIDGNAFQQAQVIKTRDTLITGYKYLNANAVVAAGRAFSPNADKPPFYADLPYTYEDNKLVVNDRVLGLWKKNLPNHMVNHYADNLRKLKAIKLDWGNNDFFKHIPPTSKVFSQKLTDLGIQHEAIEYEGSHMDKVYTADGRFLNDMMPFFNTNLKFK